MEILSPLTQYYLRRLLSEQSAASGQSDKNFERLSSYEVVKQLNSGGLESASRRELETLIHHYQNLENQIAHQHEGLTEIKRRIFRLLDLRGASTRRDAIPPLVPEQNVLGFRFLQQGRLKQGIRFENEVYGLIREYGLGMEQQAHQITWALIERAIPVVLTVSEERYGLWVNLRSPTYAVLMNQGNSLLDRINLIQTKLNHFHR